MTSLEKLLRVVEVERLCVLSGCLAHRRIRWVCWLVSQGGGGDAAKGKTISCLWDLGESSNHSWMIHLVFYLLLPCHSFKSVLPVRLSAHIWVFPLFYFWFDSNFSIHVSLPQSKSGCFHATLVTVQLNLKGSHSLLWSGLGRTVSQVQLLPGQQPTSSG